LRYTTAAHLYEQFGCQTAQRRKATVGSSFRPTLRPFSIRGALPRRRIPHGGDVRPGGSRRQAFPHCRPRVGDSPSLARRGNRMTLEFTLARSVRQTDGIMMMVGCQGRIRAGTECLSRERGGSARAGGRSKRRRPRGSLCSPIRCSPRRPDVRVASARKDRGYLLWRSVEAEGRKARISTRSKVAAYGWPVRVNATSAVEQLRAGTLGDPKPVSLLAIDAEPDHWENVPDVDREFEYQRDAAGPATGKAIDRLVGLGGSARHRTTVPDRRLPLCTPLPDRE